jgi:plasmid stabilization system protein ParE
MMYLVETTESAEQEFEDQYDYIAKRSPQRANSWAVAFRDALKKLKTNPTSYALAPESRDPYER